MIFERLDPSKLAFDIERLKQHLRECVIPLAPMMMGEFFGGWSVWSSDGSYRDGFQSGQKLYDKNFEPGLSLAEKAKLLGVKLPTAYRQPTEICTGYLNEAMNSIRDIGFEPCRPRISILRAGGQSTLHRDAADNVYMVRLQVPIITNLMCTFETDEGAAHLPADGCAYLLRVNRMHQVFNRSNEDRFHLIVDVTDRKGISQHHRLNDSNRKLEL